MIGSGQCNADCNVKECQWDGLDCGCAPDCNTSDYGQCKPACLKPECGYDRVPGYPSCPDEQMRFAFQLTHEVFKSPQIDYDFENYCGASTPGCDLSAWKLSFTTCVPACAVNEACLSSFRYCDPGCGRIPNCAVCDSESCFHCESGFVAFFETCQPTCPKSFEEHPLVPGLCAPMKDVSTLNNPVSYYIASHDETLNLGSSTEPFRSLSHGFASVHTHFVRIYLLRGIHYLTQPLPNSYMRSTTYDSIYSGLDYSDQYYIEVAPLYCRDDPHPECVSDEYATLRIVNTKPVLFHLRGHVELIGLRFEGATSLIPDCDSQLCYYCPRVMLSAGKFLDDRQQTLKVGSFAPQTRCDEFHESSFINIEMNGDIHLSNVSFVGFRQQFASLITCSNGSVALNNVTFSEVMVNNAVIMQTGETLDAVLRIATGSVELMNNGYEYVPDIVYAGFLSVESAKSVRIEMLKFSYNTVGIGGSLLNIANFVSLTVSDCVFEHTFGRILTTVSKVTLPKDIDSEQNLVYFSLSHITITDTRFAHNSGKSLIFLTFSGDLQNISILNCHFDSNLSTTTGLLSIASLHSLRYREVSGQTLSVINSNKRVRVMFPAMWTLLANLTITNTTASGHGLVYLSTLANVRITQVTIQGSGESDNTRELFETTLKYFLSFAKVYMSRSVNNLKTVDCDGLVRLESIAGLYVSQVDIVGNKCAHGAPGLLATNISHNSNFTDIRICANTGNDTSKGIILDFSTSNTASFHSLTIDSNTNSALTGIGIVHLSSSSSAISISDSQFIRNFAASGGALQIAGSVIIYRSKFDSNMASGQTAAGLVYGPLARAAVLSLIETEFLRNSAVFAGAVSITDESDPPATIDLSIVSSIFSENRSAKAGACLHISISVKLSTSSLISKSSFTNNSAANACIHSSFQSGILIIDSSSFRDNNSPSVAVLFAAHPASTVAVPSKIVIQHSVISSNNGTSIVAFNNQDYFTEGESHNLTFENNSGEGFFLQFATWRDSDSVFINNTAINQSPCFSLLYSSHGHIRNTTFHLNSAGTSAGAIYTGAHSLTEIDSCRLTNNSAGTAGGAIYTDQEGRLLITNSYFQMNKAGVHGSAVFFFTGTLRSMHTISGSVFEGNECKLGTLGLITSNVTLVNSTFHDNSAVDTPGILLYLSAIQVVGSRFAHQTGNKGAFICAPASSVILISSTKFANATARDRGAAVYISSSVAVIEKSEFVGLIAEGGAAVAGYASSQLAVFGSIFSEISANAANGGVIFLSESEGNVSNSQFRQFVSSAIVGESSLLSVDLSVFFEGKSDTGAGLYCAQCASVTVKQSHFSGLQAESAAGLFLSAVDTVTITDCVFEANIGNESGAVVISNSDAVVSDTIFTGNSANIDETGDGGGVVLSCMRKTPCNVTIRNTVFNSNSAAHNGGALCWTDFQPTLENVTFINNTAKYGANLASFPVKLGPVVASGSFELREVPSGQPAQSEILVALMDHYHQTITTDSTSLADLFPVFPSNTTVSGSTRVIAVQGLFHFSAYQITHFPNQSTLIKVQTSSLPDLQIPVYMRPCAPGESLISNLCYLCPAGQYSLNPEKACGECPIGAICLGRADMAPQPGYWRPRPDTDKFWKCPDEDACLGTNKDKVNAFPIGECLEGYFGNMCNGCVSGFSRSSRASCSRCPDRSVNILRIIGISIAALLIVLFIIKCSLISAHRVRSQYSIYLKIFLNYLQLVAVTSSIELAWPTSVLQVFKMQEAAGSVSEQLFSFDCFIDTQSIDNQTTVVYLKLVIMAATPMLILAVALAFWCTMAVVHHSAHYLKYELVNSLVVLFFIAHPSLVKAMLDVFNCKEIDNGEFWLGSYLNIRCWDRIHSKYALLVALPGVILWGIGVPSVALMMLIVAKKRYLDDLNTRIRFGFLYFGYKTDAYYWEFLILYRKLILILFLVFFTNVSISIQSLSVMCILLISFMLQMKRKPFNTAVFNDLEQRAILVSAVTIYCGLFIATKEVTGWPQITLIGVVFLANGYFLTLWIVETGKAGCGLIRQWIPKVKTMLQTRRNGRVIPGGGISSSKQPSVLSFSASVSRVRDRQHEDVSLEISPLDYHRAPKESRILGPENTPIGSVDVSMLDKVDK